MNFWNKLSKKSKITTRKSQYNPDNNWLIVRKLFNPICGDHFLIQNSGTGKILMKKMIGTDNESTAHAMLKSFEFRKKMKSRNVLEMKDFDVEVKSELCSQYFYFSVYYAYPEKDLSDLFTERNNEEEDFAHEELLQMFYDISIGVLNLSRKDDKREIGFLQMNKVFWDDDANCYNVIENFLNKKINEVYMTLMLSRNPFAVLSPEIMVRNKQIFEKVNRLKMDAFNLGMMILCLGLGTKPGEFYNVKYNQLNSELLKSSLEQSQQKYHENPLLNSIVSDLLVETPELRLDLREINQKYPTQDQVSVFLKSNSHASTDIDRHLRENLKMKQKSMTQNSQSHGKNNSFNNFSRNKVQVAKGNSYMGQHNYSNFGPNKSLRNETSNGIKPITKNGNFQKNRPGEYQQKYMPQQRHNTKGVSLMSPQYPPPQGKKRVSRKLMSMGNIQSPVYPQNRNVFQYNLPNQGNIRNSTELNTLLKKGDADFFNS